MVFLEYSAKPLNCWLLRLNMIRSVSYLHPFKAGDLISTLPGIKHIYDTTGVPAVIYQRLGMREYFDFPGQCMGLQMFKMLEPLLKSQEYILDFRVWEGERVDCDTTPSRDSMVLNLPNEILPHWVWAGIPELHQM